MSDAVKDRLYDLLPSVYRMRDERQGQSLRALFGILEQELAAIEQDVQGLYANWFIETCDEWVVPYIGDLLKVPALHTGGFGTFSLRAYIANVLAYRRRKGTASVLEQMANDVTGWVSRVVEFQTLIGATQHVNHVRAENVRTPDLRNTGELELVDGPFDQAAHSVEIRSAAAVRGRYNIPNVGIFLWRLQSYWVSRSEASLPVGTAAPGRYTFSPLGTDAPLFNRPQTETEITHIAQEHNVPAPLRRRPLYEELEARRQALAEGRAPGAVYFGSQPVFQVFMRTHSGDPLTEIPAAEIMVCDLKDWPSPPSVRTYSLPDRTIVEMPVTVAIDPDRGRLAFPAGVLPERVEVNYAYGFSSDLGGGPYDRSDSLAGLFGSSEGAKLQRLWWAGVSETQVDAPSGTYGSLREAVQAWNVASAADDPDSPTHGVIAVLDSATYEEDLTQGHTVAISPGRELLIVAARWRNSWTPLAADWNGDLLLELVPEGLRPVLKGNIEVRGSGGVSDEPGKLVLNGLMIDGSLTVLPGELGELTLSHSTMVPNGKNVLHIEVPGTAGDSEPIPRGGGRNEELLVTIDRSICGALDVPHHVQGLRIRDSIIDPAVDPGEAAYPAPAIWTTEADAESGPVSSIERSTVLGTVNVREITLASETIFTAPVNVVRLQTGCVRYSFVPPGSRAPRRFRCQPDREIAVRIERARADAAKEGRTLPEAEKNVIADAVEGWLHPIFTSIDHGEAGYGQLAPVCPEQVRSGAEDGSEMGVFSHLKQPQREANLRINLAEYLRFGMEAGIFYIN